MGIIKKYALSSKFKVLSFCLELKGISNFPSSKIPVFYCLISFGGFCSATKNNFIFFTFLHESIHCVAH